MKGLFVLPALYSFGAILHSEKAIIEVRKKKYIPAPIRSSNSATKRIYIVRLDVIYISDHNPD